MNTASFTLTLLALTGVACSPDYGQPRVFQVDSIFDDAQMSIMQKEADVLCDATDGEKCFELTREESPHDITSDPEHHWSNAFSAACATQDGDTLETDILFRVPKTAVGERLQLLVRHELGHAAGCWAHLSDGNVMTDGIGEQPDNWTKADVACILGESK